MIGTLLLMTGTLLLGDPAPPRTSNAGLLRIQYQRGDESFCQAGTCVDYQNNGRRGILLASRKTRELSMLEAATGKVRWKKVMAGDQQSILAYDLDRDGNVEIIYTTSSPGRLYVLDGEGNVKRQWTAEDGKLGNSAVVLDADHDGVLDGFFGTRTKHLVRLNMADLTVLGRRTGWVQCGCYTSAMDVDHDGQWDLFAGSGDDHRSKGQLVRYDPLSLKTIWKYDTDDNASSADPVLVDIDGDGQVEIVKSVDNYAGDEAHDAVYAFETDGKLLWKVPGLSCEDSPNVADLDGDGEVEIIGMTFGGEVFCLDGKGKLQWKRDLRPELDDSFHAYMTPILCDVDGKPGLEILAMTNGGYTKKAAGIVFVLSSQGKVLDQLNVGGDRYWGEAFYANIDQDPAMELVVSGSGGMDVIETRGLGPKTEHYQRRRNYQRLNHVPWAYEDSYFIHRGMRTLVENRTDNLVLERANGKYQATGRFLTEVLEPPAGCRFVQLHYDATTPAGTSLEVNLLNQGERTLLRRATSGSRLNISEPVQIEFVFRTDGPDRTPLLDRYQLRFDRAE
jgi:outer membrane protein assembly factor BamB